MASPKAPEVQTSYATVTHVNPKGVENNTGSPSGSSLGDGGQEHGRPVLTATGLHPGADAVVEDAGVRKGFLNRELFAYITTKEFWIVLVLGWVACPSHACGLNGKEKIGLQNWHQRKRDSANDPPTDRSYRSPLQEKTPSARSSRKTDVHFQPSKLF